jgi:flagellar biosynthesis protein FliP
MGDSWNVKNRRLRRVATLLTLVCVPLLAAGCGAQSQAANSSLTLQVNSGDQSGYAWLQVAVLFTVLSLLPAMVMTLTSFTRIIIVLSFVRNAMGVAQLPPNQVLLGLALFLTIFVMAPVWQQANDVALQPYLRGEITEEVAFQKGMEPLRQFMFKHTREKDLSLFVQMAKIERPRNQDDVPSHVLIPAFMISEIKTGFQMGFMIFIPFLVIDMVISSTLMSMGMVMLPPIVISLPFKVLLFVLVDGWHLIVKSLLMSFS